MRCWRAVVLDSLDVRGIFIGFKLSKEFLKVVLICFCKMALKVGWEKLFKF
jgi:hypothetical protein